MLRYDPGRGQETTLIWSGLTRYMMYVFTRGIHFRPQCKYVLKYLVGYFLQYTTVIISKKQSVNVILSWGASNEVFHYNCHCHGRHLRLFTKWVFAKCNTYICDNTALFGICLIYTYAGLYVPLGSCIYYIKQIPNSYVITYSYTHISHMYTYTYVYNWYIHAYNSSYIYSYIVI